MTPHEWYGDILSLRKDPKQLYGLENVTRATPVDIVVSSKQVKFEFEVK